MSTNAAGASTKVELFRLTWTEVAAAFERDPVILIPLGSIEQHGPQTPVGDYRYMTQVSRRIAEATGALVAPTIPWGYSEYFKNYPGCLTLRPETLKELLLDTVDGFLRHGLTKLAFVCGHKGNMPIIEQVARAILEENGVRTVTIEPLGWLDKTFLSECYGTESFRVGHGSDPMSSIALHLFPDDTRPDLLEKGEELPRFADLPMQGMSAASLDGFPITVYCNTEELSANGVLGDPSMASAEVGRMCVERMVERGIRFVEWFATQDTRVRERTPSATRAAKAG